MSNYTCTDLLNSLLGTVVFPVFAFAPGYLLASITNLLQFRTRSLPERILWSVTLSLPLSLAFANLAGRILSSSATLFVFELFAAACLLLLLFEWRRKTLFRRADWGRETTIAALCMVALTLFILLSVVGIQVGHRLYESSISQDWNVRTQLVEASIRGPVPPGNPMFAYFGHAAPLRYYYFWYVLCAQVNRLTGIDAKSSLAASCVWSGFALFSCIFLCIKHLRLSAANVRRQCLTALLVSCVLGLGVLPAIVDLFLPRMRLYPDLEFWHDDRSPGFLGALIWAPHHVAGMVCCIIGILLIVLAVRQSASFRRLLPALLAGVCFAAAAGTSTYITAFFVLFCALWVLYSISQRDWPTLLFIAVAGVASLLLSLPYIHEMLASTAVTTGAGPTHRFLQFSLRSNDQAHYQVNYMLRYFRHQAAQRHAPIGQILLRLPLILGFYIAEFGFFLFVLIDRIRTDFFSRNPISPNARLLWLLFASFAIPGFFLSSVALQTNNDLGRHAGMCMRFVLLLWAVPWVIEVRDRLRTGRIVSPRRRWMLRLAAAAFLLGLATQLWQIVILRIYIPLVDSGRIASYVVPLRFPRIATRFYDLRRAADALTANTSANAIVQSNPMGRLQPIVYLYEPRQLAAVDQGCNVPFGGNPNDCSRIVHPIIALFGGSGPRRQGDPPTKVRIPFDPTQVTPANFAAVCQQQSIAAMIATYTDPVWQHPDTWVWLMHPLYANSTARVFLCPKNSPAP